ncbi:MAG: hypothetical protein PHD83_02215 [Caldisericia bacterium]|nr:hypothetical protein [Caldisericia bacterium]
MKHFAKKLSFLLTLLICIFTMASCSHFVTYNQANLPQKQDGITNDIIRKDSIELFTHFTQSQILGGVKFYEGRCFVDLSEEKDSDYGKICEIDLQNGSIKASTQRLYRQSLKSIQFNYLQTISRYAYNFYSIDTFSPVGGIDRTEYEMLLLQEQFSICVERFQYNSSWFCSIVCLDNHFEQKWEFIPKLLKKEESSYFAYPEAVVLNHVVHCFFNQQGEIYHYGLDLDTGREVVNELLFTSPYQIIFGYNDDKTYLPINRSSFLLHTADEAILINSKGVTFSYKQNVNLEMLYWKWTGNRLSYQKKHSTLITNKSDSEYIIRFNKPVNNVDMAIIEMESETIDQIFCIDLFDLKIIGDRPVLETKENQIVRIHFDGKMYQNKGSDKLLLETVDISAPLDRKPPNYTLIMFDMKTAQETWTKIINNSTGVHFFCNPYIWIVKEDDDENRIGFDIYDVEGICVGKIDAKQDLQESWLDFQQKKKTGVINWVENYSVVCSVYDSNRVYFVTSNGYIYQWKMHD